MTFAPTRDVISTLRASSMNVDDNTAQDGHLVVFGWQENQLAGNYRDDGTTETLTTTKTQAVMESQQVRRLTPVECERLMGWPDDHTAGQADSHRYKQCGNGVVSNCTEWIGCNIMQANSLSTLC